MESMYLLKKAALASGYTPAELYTAADAMAHPRRQDPGLGEWYARMTRDHGISPSDVIFWLMLDAPGEEYDAEQLWMRYKHSALHRFFGGAGGALYHEEQSKHFSPAVYALAEQYNAAMQAEIALIKQGKARTNEAKAFCSQWVRAQDEAIALLIPIVIAKAEEWLATHDVRMFRLT